MQTQTILAALRRAAQAPALAGIYIKSVSLCAVRQWQHDAVLSITWSMPDGGSSIDMPSLPGVTATALSRPSDTAILLARNLTTAPEIEDAVIGAAWALGAWDLCRIESPPLPPGSDWHEARYGVGVGFGRNPYTIMGQPMVMGDRAEDDVCATAARDGYITWRFVPLALATLIARQRWGAKDTTLQSDCTRVGEPGQYRGRWWHPQTPGHANEHQYQLGRGNHGNRSKSSRERIA